MIDVIDGIWTNLLESLKEGKRVLLQPMLGQLPGIYHLHKEESALTNDHLVYG